MISTIFEQLKAECKCNSEDIHEADVKELISLVSMATCWTQKPCETFLLSEREERFDLPTCLDDCGIFTIEPFYYPFDPESFEITLIKRQGIEEEEIAVEDFAFSKSDGKIRVDLPIPDCRCQVCTCDCPPEYQLIVKYIAGYDELPDCLLPYFCEAIKYIAEKNECDCGECEICVAKNDINYQIEYEDGISIVDRLNYYFVQMLTEQYKRQIGLISLCGRGLRYWGEVV